MKRKALALACAFLAGNAVAAPFLNFDGSADGALIRNFYNGGTDSLGNTGFDYGITFGSNATVRVDYGRTYLTNIGQINVAGGFTDGLTFLYSTFSSKGTSPSNADRQDFAIVLDTYVDRGDWQVLGNTYNMACDAYPNTYCNFGGGFARVYDGLTASRVSFAAPPYGGNPLLDIALDSITFNTIIPNPPLLGLKGSFIGDAVSSEVPEPSTIALLGLGLLGFAASRRKLAKGRDV